jgi:hypothetical protein
VCSISKESDRKKSIPQHFALNGNQLRLNADNACSEHAIITSLQPRSYPWQHGYAMQIKAIRF